MSEEFFHRIEGNDSVWFSRFNWANSKNVAKRIEIDICWNEINGYTYAFLDAFPENQLYYTLGLRQCHDGSQLASMSVIRHKSNMHMEDIEIIPGEGFQGRPGYEDDIICIGEYLLNIGEFYRLIISAYEDRVEGYIYRWRDKAITNIGVFVTGVGSRIMPRSSNGVSPERVGMRNASESKSCISIRYPLRVDINNVRSGVSRGMIVYQRCPNVNIEHNPDGSITLSHGGNTMKRN